MVGTNNFDSIRPSPSDRDPCVRYWGAVACTAAKELPDSIVRQLHSLFGDESEAVRIEAAAAVARHVGEDSAFQTLLDVTDGSNEVAILHAARALELLGDERVRGDMVALAERFADAPGDVAWCIRFRTSDYLRRVP